MTAPDVPFELTDRHLDVDSGALTFSFGLGDDTFTETFTLAERLDPVVDPAHPSIGHLLDVAHLCVGVSYYKLTLPGRIVAHRPLHPAISALVPHLYDHGLRELAIRNDLAVPLEVSINAPAGSSAEPVDLFAAPGTTDAGPLVPFGGGKDSTLTLSVLADADPVAFSIHPTPVQRRAAAAVGVPLLSMTRRLDPLLSVRTAEGGWNGHIPITAINSSVSAIIAALLGRHDVVIANERSAEEPTMRVDDVPVNHQYSKTFRFENALADAIAPTGIRYWSSVRRWSELAIAGALAHRGALRNAILSCNRAFSLTNPDPDPHWCRNCAKCRFTFVSFAPFLTPDEATEMFGGNLLDDPEQIEGVRALWSDKPFDCVGELAESAIAVDHLATRQGWRDTVVVKALRDDAARVAVASGTDFDALLRPAGDDRVPPSFVDRIDGALHAAAISTSET
ncbi:MAG TPA: hypothetical protein VFN21_13490 [Acidimicrobiales bacterium]|nr:hypothetical protein [Acidimicrobiales bacterium]